MPLALVARLEEIDLDKVEMLQRPAGGAVPRQLMPLVQMRRRARGPAESGRKPVLVFTDRDRTMGLVVDEIVDIVEDR